MPQVGNDPRNGSWEKEFEKNGSYALPDCRVGFLERDNHRVYLKHIGQEWDTVYCAACHQPWAAVPPDCPHVFFICSPCVNAHGAPPDCVQVPGT